jgi:hypothetical protein
MKGSLLTGGLLFAMILLAAVVSTATAPAGHYTISGGTVYDTKTGLTWEQSPSSSTMQEAVAATHCSGLSGAAWRLPTLKELATIVDFTTSNPSIDTSAFHGIQSSGYWTSTIYNPSTADGWLIFFDTGGWGPTTLTSNGYVICVH